MSDLVVMVVAGFAALVLVVVFLKLLGNVIKAVLIAAIAAGALYMLLPRLEAQDGKVADVARKAREATKDMDGTVQQVKERASVLAEDAKDAAGEAAVEAKKVAEEAAVEVKKAAGEAKKAVEEVREAN